MDVFAAIADPSRRRVLELLAAGGRSAGELGAALPKLTQPAVSRHLRMLREAGLVEVQPRAQQRIYSLKPDKLAELDVWLQRYRHYWSGRLDALERHLHRTHPRKK